jgi:signal transduction histidine kinase/ligand-binding sensor domain-containing protein
MRMRYMRSGVIPGLVLLSIANPASALDPNLRITQYRHAAWRLQEGAFASAPNAIAQTKDGYIWLGTGSGLVKYDGVRFSPWSPPAAGNLSGAIIYSLTASSDGTLWIGTSMGLASWKNGQLQEHVRGRINSILEDRKGRIWAARSRVPDPDGGLCQVVGEHPGCIGGDDRMQLPYAGALAEDPQGNLWIGGADQLMRWRDGSFKTYLRKELEPLRAVGGIDSIAVADDGAVWVAIRAKGMGLSRIAHDVMEKTVLPGFGDAHAVSLFIDREGSLWIGTSDAGVYRLYAGRLDHFSSGNGLSSNAVTGFFEDREGNLWVATSKGLDRFGDNRVVTFSTSEGLSADIVGSVLATEDGVVWIGNRGSLDVLRVSDVLRANDVVRGHDVHSIPIPGQRVTSLWQDRAKHLWVGVDNMLTIYDRGRFRKINRPDGSPLGTPVAITEDREQNVWVSVVEGRKVFRIHDLRVEEDFPTASLTRHLAADPAGGIWLASTGNLGHYRGGKLEMIPVQLKRPVVRGLAVDADGSAWVSTANGLIHRKNGRMETLTSGNGLPCDGIFSTIRDNSETLWLYSQCGLIGIPDSELRQWWQQPNRTIKFRVLDVFDGAAPGPSTFQPAVSKSPDGRLWFANDTVLQMIDPGGLRKNSVAPPVFVEELHADRKDFAIGGLIRLPPHSRDIEIRYTALSFSIPEKIQFRYKLDKRDQKWQDAGTRREAFYSDLDPGRYRFHVMASNNDGVWNEAGDTLEFSIAPAFNQTIWFRALLAVVTLAILWGLYRLRLYQVAREFSAQSGERARIARDLHDTLLQSFQGVLLKFSALSYKLPENSEVRADLEEAIDRARDAITEGRDAVQGLRSSTPISNDLARSIGAIGEELVGEQTGTRQSGFRMHVEGASRDLPPLVRDEVYRIGVEALRNAFRYAEAGEIEVEIRYDPRRFTMRVRDNGKGIDPAVLNGGGRAGHHGLAGMHERASLAGGTLAVWSKPGAGTEIELRIAAAIAYRKVTLPPASKVAS